jgi:hypothetical protein
MTKRRPRSLVLFFVITLSAAVPASAQNVPDPGSPVADCYLTQKMFPNLHCTCASAHAQPVCSQGTPIGSLPALTPKQMIQTQVAGTLIDAFVNMLFSDDSQAKAQKQKMMAELAARQAEAERQHKIEEAQRLAAICSRLQATLKLSGVPDLQIKRDWNDGSGDGLRSGRELSQAAALASHSAFRRRAAVENRRGQRIFAGAWRFQRSGGRRSYGCAQYDSAAVGRFSHAVQQPSVRRAAAVDGCRAQPGPAHRVSHE